ncbi:MAG: hypothetical protein Q7O66_08665 [Dehalococcoidia bacterium]|nr:hypothetical protein [Dehalococcoidia bacterium]
MVRYKRRTFAIACSLLAVLFFLTQMPAATSLGAPPDPPPDRHFGAVESFWAPDQATEMGVGWERIIFSWKSLQPNSPDDWNPFYFPDAALAREIAGGREVVGLLISTPPWASGSNDPRMAPKNLYLPYDDPYNYWGAFVKKIAARYKGRIDSWVIWNEPDVWDARESSSAWLGSEADYYQLLKIASQAAKSVNPNAKIVFAGLTYYWDKSYGRDLYLKRVLDIAANDPTARANGYYFDVVNLHLYNLPEQMYTIPLVFKKLLADYNLTKPIWLGEVNVVPYDDQSNPLTRADYQVSLEEQASFVVQSMALSLAAGVDRIAFYKLKDDPSPSPNDESYGFIRNNGFARPAFAAFRTAARFLSGAKEAKWTRLGDVNTVIVQRGGEVTTVLWNSGPRPITVQIPSSAYEGHLIDKYGFGLAVRPSEGKYNFVLPPATAVAPANDPQRYFIGGDPLLLVELATKR